MSDIAGSPALGAGLDRVAALWRWWTAELTGMLPAAVQRQLTPPPPVLLATPTEQGFRFHRLHQGRLQPQPQPDAALPTWLVLPRSALLVKRLDWPLLPAADLRRSLELDLDRQTPFPAEAVRFDSIDEVYADDGPWFMSDEPSAFDQLADADQREALIAAITKP